jgi:Myo-inositol-1-phosphate synthase
VWRQHLLWSCGAARANGNQLGVSQGASGYLPQRGDNKEDWDNIDIFGWLGYAMRIKVDILCRDSMAYFKDCATTEMYGG